LCELLVGLRRIDADHEVLHVSELPNERAALTERATFGGSPTGERFGEPREDDRLALELRQAVGLAVGAWQREIRRLVADFELLGRRPAAKRERPEGDRDGGQRSKGSFHRYLHKHR